MADLRTWKDLTADSGGLSVSLINYYASIKIFLSHCRGTSITLHIGEVVRSSKSFAFRLLLLRADVSYV